MDRLLGHDEADKVRSALGADSVSVLVANAGHGGIPDRWPVIEIAWLS
jgi:hypothetical protein